MDFSAFFSVKNIRFPRSHDQGEECATAYLDSLLNAGLPDSESDSEPWHKITAPKKRTKPGNHANTHMIDI